MELQGEQKFINGIRFCPQCYNILVPRRANEFILQMHCGNCGKKQIDFSEKSKDQSLLYSKELKAGMTSQISDKQFALDPSMARIQTTCAECGYDTAVFFLQPQSGQRRIKVTAVCAYTRNNKPACGNIWEIEQQTNINQSYKQ